MNKPPKGINAATACFKCRGITKEGIDNCEYTHCYFWPKRKFSPLAIRKEKALMDIRVRLGLEPVDEHSPLMQYLYKVQGIEMYPTDESASEVSAPIIKEKKERKKKHSHAEREAIRRSHASVRALADKYDCSPTTIQKIKAGV